MGSVRGTTGFKGKKHDLDKFYTKASIAAQLIPLIPELNSYEVIIEPSAGSGSFLSALSSCLHLLHPEVTVKGYDLDPESDNIEEADWFAIDKSQFIDHKTLVVGNPPFGTSGNLAMRFIKESSFADAIAFVLPRSFRKESVKRRIPANFWNTLENDTPKNSFTLNEKNYDINCVFQVWKKEHAKRPYTRSKSTSHLISFVTKDNADFRIQRVGGNAGKASLDIERSISSNYFAKNTSKLSTNDLIDLINSLEYPTRDHSAGPRSLAKGELIPVLEEAFQKHYSK